MKLKEEPNPFYRWSLKGETPILKVRKEKTAVSFYGGLSLREKKVITHQCEWQNSLETIKFLDLLKDKYKDQIENKEKILLVWDGASYHKSEEIRDWLKGNNKGGWLELINFPTYSPEINPQEKVWRAVRKELSKVVHEFTFREIVDRACRILLTEKFDYKFF